MQVDSSERDGSGETAGKKKLARNNKEARTKAGLAAKKKEKKKKQPSEGEAPHPTTMHPIYSLCVLHRLSLAKQFKLIMPNKDGRETKHRQLC